MAFIKTDSNKNRKVLNKNVEGFMFQSAYGNVGACDGVIKIVCGSGSVTVENLKINTINHTFAIGGLDIQQFALTLLIAEKHIDDWFERSGDETWMNSEYVMPKEV